jgi:hypothetical protein
MSRKSSPHDAGVYYISNHPIPVVSGRDCGSSLLVSGKSRSNPIVALNVQ